MNPAQLLAHFDRVAEAPDAIPRLRRFILDLAVRGKLVEQDPNDEPASELLAHVKKLKSLMLLEKRIRGDQDVEYSMLNIGVDIPPTWTWVHLNDVAIVQGGKRLPIGCTFSKEPTDHIYVRVTDMKNSTINRDDVRYITPVVHHAIARYTISKDDLYITIAGTIGQVGRVPSFFDGHNLTENAAKIVFRGMSRDYLCLALSSDVVQQQFKDKTNQVAQPKLALKRILGARFALPPLAEQHRIVARVDELMALCDRLEAAQAEREARRDRLVASSLARLNGPADGQDFRDHARFHLSHLPRLTTSPEHVRQLRQTILNLAVRGKLVEQDPGDEPASELLKRIQAERARLLTRGKSGKQSLLASVEPRDLPFSAPKHWAWLRLSGIGALSGGMTPSKNRPDFWDGDINWFSPKDIKSDELVDSELKITPSGLSETSLQLYPPGCLFIVARSGILKRTFPVSINRVDAAANQDLKVLAPFIHGMERYLQIMFRGMTDYVLSALVKTGTTVQSLKYEEFELQPFPLPPLAEQHRIAAKVDELMAVCDRLEAQLTTAQDESRLLLEAILHRAVNRGS